jgi:hypothetical protein
MASDLSGNSGRPFLMAEAEEMALPPDLTLL